LHYSYAWNRNIPGVTSNIFDITKFVQSVKWSSSTEPQYESIELVLKVKRNNMARLPLATGSWVVIYVKGQTGKEFCEAFGYVTHVGTQQSAHGESGTTVAGRITVSCVGWFDMQANAAIQAAWMFQETGNMSQVGHPGAGGLLTPRRWQKLLKDVFEAGFGSGSAVGQSLELFFPHVVKTLVPHTLAGNPTSPTWFGDAVPVVWDNEKAQIFCGPPRGLRAGLGDEGPSYPNIPQPDLPPKTVKEINAMIAEDNKTKIANNQKPEPLLKDGKRAPLPGSSRICPPVPGPTITAVQSAAGGGGGQAALTLLNGTFMGDPGIMEMFPSFEDLGSIPNMNGSAQHTGAYVPQTPANMEAGRVISKTLGRTPVLIYRIKPFSPEPLTNFVKDRLFGAKVRQLPGRLHQDLFETTTWSYGTTGRRPVGVNLKDIIEHNFSWDDSNVHTIFTCDPPMTSNNPMKYMSAAGLPIVPDADLLYYRGLREYAVNWPFLPDLETSGKTDLQDYASFAFTVAALAAQFYAPSRFFISGSFTSRLRLDIRHGEPVDVQMVEGMGFQDNMMTAYVTKVVHSFEVEEESGTGRGRTTVYYERGVVNELYRKAPLTKAESLNIDSKHGTSGFGRPASGGKQPLSVMRKASQVPSANVTIKTQVQLDEDAKIKAWNAIKKAGGGKFVGGVPDP
jgi:hypothetical protein